MRWKFWREERDAEAEALTRWRLAVSASLHETAQAVKLLTKLLQEPPAFVSMVVLGERPQKGDIPVLVGGDAVLLTGGTDRARLSITLNNHFENAQVIVLSDLALVHVDSIWVGNHSPAMNVGSGAPVAYLGRAEPGQQIRAEVRRRPPRGTP